MTAYSPHALPPAADRVWLAVPYHEREGAKRAGAHWDPVCRAWWITRRDLVASPDARRWLQGRTKQAPSNNPSARHSTSPATSPAVQRDLFGEAPQPVTPANRKGLAGPVLTPARDFSLPVCCCSVPPWEHCPHTGDKPVTIH